MKDGTDKRTLVAIIEKEDRQSNTIDELVAMYFNDRITLTGVKIYHGLSQETTAFTATVNLDGKRIATAENTGQGGGTMYHAISKSKKKPDFAESHAGIEEAEKIAKALGKQWIPSYDGSSFSIDMNLEHLIDNLVFAADAEKDAKRGAKNKLKFAYKETGPGQWHITVPTDIDRAYAEITKEYGKIVTYQHNRIPFLLYIMRKISVDQALEMV